MDRLVAVTNYLSEHWANVNATQRQRQSDIEYYAGQPHPYGPVFAAKLRSTLHKELEATA